MNLHTEKEFFINNSFFAFKLRNLYTSNEQLFYQVSDYVPNCVYINKRKNFDYTFWNINSLKAPETELLVEKGYKHLSKISCPLLLEKVREKVFFFREENNYDSTCSFVQGIKMHNSLTYTFTNKLLLSEDLFFNISNKLNDFGELGRITSLVFDSQLKDLHTWQRFLSLTKQEKRIIRLLANGESNKTIGDLLFITENTVKTHRKNIYKKVDAHSLKDIIHIAMTLDFLE